MASWVNLLGYQKFSVLTGPPLGLPWSYIVSIVTLRVFHRKFEKKTDLKGSGEWTDFLTQCFFFKFRFDDLTSEGVICVICVTLKRTFQMAPEKWMFFF